MSYGLLAIAAERKRQIDKGYTPDHDWAEHPVGALINAAEAYLDGRMERLPWHAPADWDDLTLVERLTTAGALITAALDVLLTDNGNES